MKLTIKLLTILFISGTTTAFAQQEMREGPSPSVRGQTKQGPVQPARPQATRLPASSPAPPQSRTNPVRQNPNTQQPARPTSQFPSVAPITGHRNGSVGLSQPVAPLSPTRSRGSGLSLAPNSLGFTPSRYPGTLRSNNSSVKFLRFKKTEAEIRRKITEDCQVFRVLLNRSLPLTRRTQAMGLAYQQYFGNNTVEYNDLGLTFTFHVNLQLHPTAQKNSASQAPQKEKKSDWDLAKEALVNSNRPANFQSFQNEPIHSNTDYFNKEAVANIKEAVRLALGQSSNIRGLQAGDKVSVYLIGTIPGNRGRSVVAMRTQLKQVVVPDADPSKTSSNVQRMTRLSPSAIEESSYFERYNPSQRLQNFGSPSRHRLPALNNPALGPSR